MSGMVSRWPVLQEHPVTAHDLDAGGTVSDEAVRRWVAAARADYLDRCTALAAERDSAGLELRHRDRAVPPGAALGRPASVAVSAGVSEFLPNSFTVSVRLRPIGGDRETPVSASCSISLEDSTGTPHELGKAVRDELIAMEHAAGHFN